MPLTRPDIQMNQTLADHFSVPEDDLARIVDLRNLEAPEPLVIILTASTQLGPDDTYRARLPHAPAPLFPHLEARGLGWQLWEDADGSVVICIRKRA